LIPLAALPAVAGSVSFSLNMTGEYKIVPVNDGGPILARAELQPLAGTIAPFGQAQATFSDSGSTATMTFTLGNGMTIAASVVATIGTSPSQPTTLNGTITGGIGVFQGATGTFTATLTPVQAGAGPTSIPVALTGSGNVTAPNAPGGLNVLPSVLRFDVPNGSVSPVSQNLMLDNEGLSAEAFQVSVTTASGGNWLSVSAVSGSVASAETFPVAVTADPAPGKTALKPGVYVGTVTVTYAAVSVSVKTYLIIGGLGANLLLSETGLTFQGGEGGYPSHSMNVQVENVGVGDLTGLTAKTSITGPGTNWLHAAITPIPGNPQVSTAAISVSSLPAIAGTYYGRVDFLLPGAVNSPQSVSVVLQIIPGPIPDITPGAVAFETEYISGQSAIPVLSQDVKLINLGTTAVNFTITGGSTGYPGNGASMDWLVFSPKTGSLGPGSYATFTASVPSGCLGAGDPCLLSYVNYGWINVTFKEDAYTAAIPVQFTWPTIYASLGLGSVKGPAMGMAPAAVAGCAPSQVNGVFTSLLDGFKATVGLPVPIEVKIIDTCAHTMDTGTVVAAFSNGDPPLTLTGTGGGQWTGTWTPRKDAAQATVTVKAVATSAAMGMLQLSGSVAASTATPIVSVGGIVNAASYAPTIAPGALISIFGSNFGGATKAPSFPWPALLGNTQVLLGGQPLPLYFTSSSQIAAVVPYNIAPSSVQQVIVQNGTAASQPETVNVAAAQPGVFTQDQSGTGPGAIQGQKPGGIPALNTAANPASVGDALLIYCTGLGTVSPPVPAGAAASTSVLSYTDNPVTVTVGGKDAQVLFAGLAPGWVALYQVNVLVPPGITPGPSVPVVVTAAGAASTPVTVAIQ
jgi:uncharacterized protein (TIGR03437 family)